MSALDVVREALAALAAADGERLAALASDDSLRAYVDGVRTQCDEAERPPELAVLVEPDPEVPLEVRQYWDATSAEYAAERGPALLRAYQGTASLAALRSLPAAELLSRSLRGLHTSLRVATALDGVIYEGGTQAYVLFRLAWKMEAGGERDAPDIATLAWEGGRWRLVLDPGAAFGFPGYQGFSYVPLAERPPSEHAAG